MTTKNKVCIECDAILFDLDGVLIDSTECIERHWQEWADHHNIDIHLVLSHAHGVRTIETMQQVAPFLDLEKEAKAFTDNEIEDTEGVVAIPGAWEVLQNLPDHQWAIVTSGSYELVKARMRSANLPLPFYLVTADDVNHGKPSPEPYLVGAAKLGVSPNNAVVLEDAPIGVQAAKAAGMQVIGILSTHKRDELLKAGADYLVDNLQSISITPDGNGEKLKIQFSLAESS